MNATVLGELLHPMVDALERIRYEAAIFQRLEIVDFIGMGGLRYLKGTKTVREQVQKRFRLAPEETSCPPLPRSTWSDALRSPGRSQVFYDVLVVLVEKARSVLPDRLAAIPGLVDRSVRALDSDVETRNHHEFRVLRDYEGDPQAWTPKKNVLWLVDRGLISARLWDEKKRKLKSTVITRMKSGLVVEHGEARDVAAIPENRDVVRDETIALRGSPEPWRWVTFCNDVGEEIVFLTNELALEPGVVAILFLRFWDEGSTSTHGRATSVRPRRGGRGRLRSRSRSTWRLSHISWWPCGSTKKPNSGASVKRL